MGLGLLERYRVVAGAWPSFADADGVGLRRDAGLTRADWVLAAIDCDEVDGAAGDALTTNAAMGC